MKVKVLGCYDCPKAIEGDYREAESGKIFVRGI